MRKDMDLSHLSPTLQEKLYQIIRDHWSVFDEKGVFVPVKNYRCVIDTGSTWPIAVKNIHYNKLETKYMCKCIAALAKVGHIRQITDGSWLFKALLVPKPHQEHIKNIENFVWRFCVNYIPLNGMTRVIAYPIPRCDTAVFVEFSMGQFIWMFDAPMGYHQLTVAESSQEKLTFQGVDAIKWTYTVMPFGPINGPATFVNFIHDIDSVWKALAISMDVPIGDTTNTRIIIGNCNPTPRIEGRHYNRQGRQRSRSGGADGRQQQLAYTSSKKETGQEQYQTSEHGSRGRTECQKT